MNPTIRIVSRSDVGRVRRRNEDSIATDARLGLLVVADGMGGHPAGDVASELAVREVARSLQEDTSAADNIHSDDRVGAAMVQAVQSADRLVRSEALRHADRAGMGTTLTALRVDPEQGGWWIGHVGDSRAYLLRNGHLRRLTRDDTWVQDELDAGRLTPEAARRHPWSHLLSQAVGLADPPVPTLSSGDARSGDLFLVCSDGLLAHLDDETIEALLVRDLPEGLDTAADALVAAANDGGGTDNITVGLLRLTEEV